MKALIAMSGGVDSSVAALLAMEAGFEAIGCTMTLKDNDCVTEENVNDARKVCEKLGIQHITVDLKDGFREKVIDKFIWSYEHGYTPNPCVDCNKFMKFDRLFDVADEYGCDKIVTGHYARITQLNGKTLLQKAPDRNKDQSYFLYGLTQERLSRVMFPLADLTKDETRALAEKHGFINSHKKDSQDICFVTGKYARTIEALTGKNYPEGNFVLEDGTVLGRHNGIINYTRGQRKGLGIAYSEPLYVLRVNCETNEVIIGTDKELYSKELLIKDYNNTSGTDFEKIDCKARIRYRQVEQDCIAEKTEEGIKITFNEPQRAITPGQAAVLYDGDTVLGGGTISL